MGRGGAGQGKGCGEGALSQTSTEKQVCMRKAQALADATSLAQAWSTEGKEADRDLVRARPPLPPRSGRKGPPAGLC